MHTKKKLLTTKRLAWAAAVACVGCCTIPVAAAMMGLTSIAGLALYFDQTALGFFLVAAGLFAFLAFRRTRTFCRPDCSCKPDRQA